VDFDYVVQLVFLNLFALLLKRKVKVVLGDNTRTIGVHLMKNGPDALRTYYGPQVNSRSHELAVAYSLAVFIDLLYQGVYFVVV